MIEYTKINFNYRKELSDFSDLMEMLFPGNRNQQYAAVCIFYELKWYDGICESLTFLEGKYRISRRILQRTRSKLSRLGIIEYVGRFNKRYHGQTGWKFSLRFENRLKNIAGKANEFRRKSVSNEKDRLLISFADARRSLSSHLN